MSGSDPVVAHVLTVGEELLSGATVDGNAAWIGRALSRSGVAVRGRSTVGDVDADIEAAVREAVAAADLVIVTGGLGPTEDDRTRPAVARALSHPLQEDPDLVAELTVRAEARGRPVTEGLRRLALRPEPGRAFRNPVGTAPGLAFPADVRGGSAGWVVLLPGVPREMRALFPQVEALVAEAFGARLTPALARSIHTTGVPESLLAPRIEAALGSDRDGVDVAYLPDLSGVELRLTARRREGESEADVSRRISAIEDRMGEVLDGIRYDAPSGDVVEALLGALIERRWRVAVAESCTGGLLGQRLTARPGASLVFEGGVIAYADAVKEALLGVPGATLEAEGAVSEAVARAMAAGVARSLGTECGVGITGVAGPGGGSAEKPVGTVWIGWCVRDEFGETVDAEHFRFGDDREAVRARAAQAAVWGLLRRVLAAGPAE